MKHKYFIIKDNEKNELIISEFAELDKKSDFSLLYEVTFSNEKIESAILKGKNALISAIRTQDMYPPIIYAEKITESIVKLYGSKNDQSIELFFDDKDFLAKDLKASKTSGVKKDEPVELDELLEEEPDNLDELPEDNNIVEKTTFPINNGEDEPLDIEEDNQTNEAT